MVAILSLIIVMVAAFHASAQHSTINLRDHVNNQSLKPRPPTPPVREQPVNNGSTFQIEVEPRTSIRRVGNLNEVLRITRGASEIGKGEITVSCGAGASLAFLPAEDKPFHFTSQRACRQILETQSEVSKCRSALAIDRQSKIIQVIRTQCGPGASAVENEKSVNGGTFNNSFDFDSIRDSARGARKRANGTSR